MSSAREVNAEPPLQPCGFTFEKDYVKSKGESSGSRPVYPKLLPGTGPDQFASIVSNKEEWRTVLVHYPCKGIVKYNRTQDTEHRMDLGQKLVGRHIQKT